MVAGTEAVAAGPVWATTRGCVAGAGAALGNAARGDAAGAVRGTSVRLAAGAVDAVSAGASSAAARWRSA